MTAPLVSGRQWAGDPEENFVTSEDGIATKALVRDPNDLSYVAIAKWANQQVGAYSLGVERVAYVLGDALGLPVPEVYLEQYAGNDCAIVRRVPQHREYLHAKNIPPLWQGIDNRDCWPLGVAFDLWLANYDRRSANLIVGPLPPGTRPGVATSGHCWLVDHGLGCLWYPGKVDPDLERTRSLDVEAVADPTAPLTPTARNRFRDVMGSETIEYRRAFTGLGEHDRNRLLDHIRAVDDHQIDVAVNEVPDAFFTQRAAQLTIAFLRARRDDIATVANDVWPL